MSNGGMDLVAMERARQIKQLGYSKEDDIGNSDLLVNQASERIRRVFDSLMTDSYDKSHIIDELKKAGALCAAAIDAVQNEHSGHSERFTLPSPPHAMKGLFYEGIHEVDILRQGSDNDY